MTNPNNPFGDDDYQQFGGSVPPEYPGEYPGNENSQSYQNGYPNAGYQQPYAGAVAEKKSVLPLVALISSIIGLLLFVFIVPPFIFGIAAIILAVIALITGKKKPQGARRTWMNWVAIGLAVVSLVVVGGVLAAGAYFVQESGLVDCATIQDDEERFECLDKAAQKVCGVIESPEQRQECIDGFYK